MIDFLLERMHAHPDALSIAMPDRMCTYRDLAEAVQQWRRRTASMPPGRVVSLEGDYGPESIAAFLALTAGGHIVVPMSPDSRAHHQTFLETGEVEFRIQLDAGADGVGPVPTNRVAAHPLYGRLRDEGHPGLVLFSSGSTGRSKAALHDLSKLLAKYRVPRQRYRTLVFLLLDHIGGVNTLFYTLSNGGTIVLSRDRSPGHVCDAIECHGVELLPTSPTFLNLLLLSGELVKRDLTSLTLVTYGTEPMPQSTLEQACRALPHARFLQTYGLTELGIMRSQSRESGSLWVRIGGEDFEWKVVEGRLWIRARSAMLGYLNAPSPFDAEGFFDTGDLVEQDGEWVRFLGRKSEIINVGGNKVHPVEVENVLLQLDNVADAAVHAAPHVLTGQIVAAKILLARPETPDAFKLRMRQFCAGRLASFKIPAKLEFASEPIHSSRFKRLRRPDSPAAQEQPAGATS